jgi:hypothetical protein
MGVQEGRRARRAGPAGKEPPARKTHGRGPCADTDSERAIRCLIALVLCCDPLAIALTAAASAWRSTTV